MIDAPSNKPKEGTAGNWILLSLRGTRSNRDAIGARLRATLPSGASLYEHVSTANGIYSASDKRVHFGLGKQTEVKSLEIRWPSGAVQTLSDVKANQVLKVTEPQ